MRTVVVQAHPLDDSCNAALLDAVVSGLAAAGTVPEVYRVADGGGPDAAVLAGVERLVLVYPTWWGGLPASLLDWVRGLVIDDVSLASMTELVAVTTCGSTRLLNTIQGEWGKRYLERRLAPRCASRTKLEWLALYKIDRQSRDQITAFIGSVEHRFADT
jgi:NAD(P)H dehydrogenase (quinone)